MKALIATSLFVAISGLGGAFHFTTEQAMTEARTRGVALPLITLSTSASSATVEDTGPVYHQATLDQLRVEPEGSSSGYARRQFMPGNHWDDADRDCQNTRTEVLVAESRVPATLTSSGCEVVSGEWYSAYDGITTTNPDSTVTQIDHPVALHQAWVSGAAGWTSAQRRAFANDLEHPEALIAVTQESNGSKGEDDPARWRPPNRGAWCGYANTVVTIKARWGLSVDRAERDALAEMVGTCG